MVRLAAQVGIKNVMAEVLPDGKLDRIVELQWWKARRQPAGEASMGLDVDQLRKARRASRRSG